MPLIIHLQAYSQDLGKEKYPSRLTIILCPPREVAPSDKIVKNKANDKPWYIVISTCRRNVRRPIEHDREIHIFYDGVWPFAVGDECNDGKNRTNQKEESQPTTES